MSKVVYYSLVPNFRFAGSRYGVGELIPGIAELPRNRTRASVANGRIAPVLFETLSAATRKQYESDLEVVLADQPEPEPETVPEAEPESVEEPEPVEDEGEG